MPIVSHHVKEMSGTRNANESREIGIVVCLEEGSE